jgi:hypothetical protein
MPDFRACTRWSGGLREARMLTKTVRNRHRQTMETRFPGFTRPATRATRRCQTLLADLRAVIVQIAVMAVPIFEQRLRQLGQIEVDRPILESIGT